MQILREHKTQTKDFSNVLLRTIAFDQVQSACADAVDHKKMICVTAPPGCGKTTALRHYQKNNNNVFIATVRSSMKAKSWWINLYQSIPGASDHEKHSLFDHRSLHYALRCTADALNKKSNALLIIDEAGKFSCKQLEYLHELRDETQETTGIVLAAPPYLKTNLARWIRLQKIGVEELHRRVNRWIDLPYPDRSELRAFIKHYGLSDPEIVKFLLGECKQFAALHDCIVEYFQGNLKV